MIRRLVSDRIPNSRSALGRVLRWPLHLLPDEMVVPVIMGPNRGLRWIVGGSVHGCWIGSYEWLMADELASTLSAGDVFYDVGANVGYYTLLASRAVGSNGRVIAFEPLPRNVRFIRRHVALNDLANVEVVTAAVVEDDGAVSFDPGDSPQHGVVAPDGSLTVPGRSLDSLDLPPPDVMKVDVEGGEEGVLAGARGVLEHNRPVIILSTHGESLQRRCYELLQDVRYEVHPLGGPGSDHVARPAP